MKVEAGQGDRRRSKRARVVKATAGHDETETKFKIEDTEIIGLAKATAGHENGELQIESYATREL